MESYYFGCREARNLGHFLHSDGMKTLYDTRAINEFPWTMRLLDGGFLHNGNHKDVYDGRVFWTVAEDRRSPDTAWFAFFWWDNSGDSRGGSNSGIYVRGFDWRQVEDAWLFAVNHWPQVIDRQKHVLILERYKTYNEKRNAYGLSIDRQPNSPIPVDISGDLQMTQITEEAETNGTRVATVKTNSGHEVLVYIEHIVHEVAEVAVHGFTDAEEFIKRLVGACGDMTVQSAASITASGGTETISGSGGAEESTVTGGAV